MPFESNLAEKIEKADEEIIEMPSTEETEAKFRQSIIGQEQALKNFAELKEVIESGIRPSKGPVHIEWLSGPSGVGKTETVKKLIDIFLKDNVEGQARKASDYLIRIDGGSYQSQHEISKILGSPPGYVGSKGDPKGYIEPLLSQKNVDNHSIHYIDDQGNERKVCFILIDEAEKANEALHKAVLRALDEGEITLNDNSKTNLTDCVFFYTSNLGSRQVRESREKGNPTPQEEIFKEAYRQYFPPEFLGRVRKMTVFHELAKEDVKKIVSLRALDIEKSFNVNGINVKLDLTPQTLEWLTEKGYDPDEGARALQKIMDDEIHKKIIRINKKYIIDGRSIIVELSKDGKKLEFYPDGEPLKKKPFKERIKKPDNKPQKTPDESGADLGEDEFLRKLFDILTQLNPKSDDKESMKKIIDIISKSKSDENKILQEIGNLEIELEKVDDPDKVIDIYQLVNDEVRKTIYKRNVPILIEKTNQLKSLVGDEGIIRYLSSNYNGNNGQPINTVEDLLKYFDQLIAMKKNKQ